MLSIELMKKLEDLKQTQRQYSEQLSKKTELKKEQYIKDVVNDFSKFFQEKGFKINAKKGVSEATYGSLKATLTHDDPSTDYMGIQFRFDLDLTALQKSKISVVLNRTKPGFSISSGISSQSESEESKLKNEILRVEKELAEMVTRLENFDNEKWHLFIKDENQSRSYQFSEPYESMYEMLSNLLK